jgi:hypothetical protein
LAIPSDEEGDASLYPYHPEEITELPIGLAMTDSDRRDILAKAKATNPNIKIFQTNRDAQKKLTFHPIR